MPSKTAKQFLVRVRDWLTWPVVNALESQISAIKAYQQSQQAAISEHDFLLRAHWGAGTESSEKRV
jgi:hypothetical protein